MLMWMISGPFYLIFCASIDMFYYIKILCDYKQDDDLKDKMEFEDNNQNRIVIYDEILSVLKAILFVF